MRQFLSGLWDRITNEPVMVIGVLQAGIACGAAFGLHVSAGQIAAIETFAAAILSVIVRQRVSPINGVVDVEDGS